MADLVETEQWEPGIYQFETEDIIDGGVDGTDNVPTRQLANRTKWLKAQVEALGNSKQPLDATLTALAALATVADRMIYSTGPDTFAITPLSAFIRTLLDDPDAATARATIGAISQGQLDAAIADYQKAAPITSLAGGTADAITGSYTPAITAQTNGMTLYVRAGSANATTTPTFTPASGTIAAKTIVKGAGQPLVSGDIAGAGHWIELQYDATLDKWVLQNPAVPFGGFGASLSSNGYQKLPSGLIIQWGTSATGAVTFPIAFPTAAMSFTATAVSTAGDGNSRDVWAQTNLSVTGVTVSRQSTVDGFYWIAIGR